jgi:hypothetical protein
MKIRVCPKCGRKHIVPVYTEMVAGKPVATSDPTKCGCGVLIDPSLDEDLQVSS